MPDINKKNQSKYHFFLLLLIGLACSSRLAFSQMPKAPLPRIPTPAATTTYQGHSLEYPYEIIEIQGKDLPHLVGLSIEKIGLFALQQNVLTHIPFQIEERDQSGQVYFKEDAPIQGTQGIFDKEDVLLVYFKDAGSQIQNTEKHRQRLLGEIAVTQHQKSGYFYPALVEPEPNRVFRSEAKFEPKSGTITTPLYQVFTDPKNFLIWNALTFHGHSSITSKTQPSTLEKQKPTLESRQLQSLLDSLKVRMSAKVLPFFIPVSMSNENIESQVAAINTGVLRQTILVKSVVRVTSIPAAYMNMRFYVAPQDLNLYATIKTRPSLNKLIAGAKASISLDGANLLNSDMQTSLLENVTLKIDGKMSPDEKKLSGMPFDKEKLHWASLETHQNFGLFAKLGMPRHSDVDVNVLYIDDKNKIDAPENAHGQTPNAGFILSHFETSKSFDFFVHLTFVNSLKQMKIREIAATFSQKPQITFRKIETLKN